MATKLYDLSVKGRYENVGSLWQGEKGQYMMLKRTFNPAGVSFKEGSDSIFVSMFEPRQDDKQQSAPYTRQSKSKQAPDFSDLDDSIPF